jgi:HPt (histidine-containing phosphotransfer) domain-containing protein
MKTDLTYLKNMGGGNIAFVKEMIHIFEEQIAELKNDMETAMKMQNWGALGKLAHKAKSSVAVMGMNDLTNQLKSLELWANEGKEIGKYKDIVDQFIKESEEAIVELNKASKEL